MSSSLSSFEQLKSVLMRGGRMTKVAGVAASFAPQLGVALVVSGPLITAGSKAAYGACVSGGAGTYLCSGMISTTQSFSPPAGQPLDVSTTEQISIITAAGDAFNLTNSVGDTSITFTDTYLSTVTGYSNGIYAYNNGSGALSITTSGTVTGTTGDGIYALNRRGTDLTIMAASVSGRFNGIEAGNDGSGALYVTATGTVMSTLGVGINVNNASSGTSVSIMAASVSASNDGIEADNNGSGALTITASGTVTSTNGAGIDAENSSSGTSLTIVAASVSGNYDGIEADNDGSGALSVTATGTVTATYTYGIGIDVDNSSNGTDVTIQVVDVTGGSDGIEADNDGSGAISITSTGTVTANNTYGIGIDVDNSSNGTDLTIQVVDVTGGSDGIEADNDGSGALSVTATGTVAATFTYGIGIDVDNSSNGTGLTIQAVDVTGGTDGIEADNDGSGAISITATGTVAATYTYGIGIDVDNSSNGTDLTVMAAAVTAGGDGIEADNDGSGAISITATGTVMSTNGAGIDVDNSSNGTDLTIMAASVSGKYDGIEADNDGSGSISITATGTVTATAPYGIGIDVDNSSNGTGLTILAASVTGGARGIEADNDGTGALSVTATGPVSASVPYSIGIDVDNSSSGTDLTIMATEVTAGGDGIEADNDGSGALSITATGTVMSTNGAGIDVDNSSNGTDLTIMAASVSGKYDGIEADNDGSGAISITATGTVTASAPYGIGIDVDNSSSGTDVTIQVVDVTGGSDGIEADNDGSGSTSISVSGDVMGGTGAGISNAGTAGVAINLNNGATVSATSGVAIADGGADATVTLNTGSAVTGSVGLGDGSDVVRLAGGDVSGVTSFDGGDDTGTGDGFIDVIQVDSTTSLAGSTVTNFERLYVNNGASFSLTDNGLTIGDGSAMTGMTVRSGGTFAAAAGVTTLTGNLNNSGTVSAPADATLRISGDTSFGDGGRFRVGVASDTATGLLEGVGGSITFEAGSDVYADVAQGVLLTPGTEVTVASATGGVTDNGLSVYDNSVLFSFTHDVQNAGSDLVLTVERGLLAGTATNNAGGSTNAESIAAAIDAYIDNVPTDNPILQYLVQFPTAEQAQRLLELVEDTLPTESGAEGSGTVASADMVIDLIMGRLSGGGFAVSDSGARQSGVAAGEQSLGGDGNWALWGRAGVSTAEYDPSSSNGFDSDTYGISLGLDGDMAEDLRAGFAAFYSSTDVDEIGVSANSNQEIDGYGVLFYAAYSPGDFYANATAGFGLNEYQSQRRGAGGVNAANYDGTQFMARAEVGKTFNFDAWEVFPHVGLRFNQVWIDGYTETGPLPTTIDEQSLTSLRGVFGIGGRYTHQMDDGSKLIPEAYVRGLQELADPNEAITGSIVGGGTFISQTTERDKFSTAAGVGFTYEADDQLSFRVMYDGEYQPGYREHSLSAAIRFQF